MATITDFNEWINAVELEDYNDVYCVYKSITELQEWGGFTGTMRTTSKGNMYFIKCSYMDDILMLASDKAKDAFLTTLEKRFAGDMTIEGWYDFSYSMEKND